VTFNETAPCPCDVFECVGDKEMEESIFIDEGLQGIDGDEDEPLHHHSNLFLLPHLKQRLLVLLPPPQQQWRRHRLRLEIISEKGAPSHVQKAHSPQ
jgi:hypothetical protein